MRKIWLIAAALAWTALAFGPARAADVPQIQPDDRVLGKADAPIVIFEFFSLTCPHCAVFDQETLPLVKKNWIDTGKAKLVYRDFPLDQEALFAAVVARCLPPQRYPGFIDAVFANQRDWATSGDYKAALAKLAKIAGMSQHDFDACTGDQKMSDAVMAAEFDAKNRYGIEFDAHLLRQRQESGGRSGLSGFRQISRRRPQCRRHRRRHRRRGSENTRPGPAVVRRSHVAQLGEARHPCIFPNSVSTASSPSSIRPSS